MNLSTPLRVMQSCYQLALAPAPAQHDQLLFLSADSTAQMASWSRPELSTHSHTLPPIHGQSRAAAILVRVGCDGHNDAWAQAEVPIGLCHSNMLRAQRAPDGTGFENTSALVILNRHRPFLSGRAHTP